MPKIRRVLLVDDHALMRAGLHALIAQDATLEVVGETGNGRDAVRLAALLQPDLVLMDISMPGMNGLEAIIDIKRRHEKIRIVVVTIHKSAEYVASSLRAGANGYLLKDASHDEFKVALRSVLDGKSYLSPDISREVVNGYLRTAGKKKMDTGWENLTHREREVLQLVAEGHPSRYIAGFFSLSVKTVDKHRSNLMKKLGLHNASMVTAYAISKGLLSE